MEIKLHQWIGIGVGLAIIIASLIFVRSNMSFLFMGIGAIIIGLPFVISSVNETRVANEKEDMFLEFTRGLVESVKTGTPISKSIINSKNKPYGVLSEHIQKLANQISLGIPLNKAMKIFAQDVNNKIVTRAITLIGQAERMGGDIGQILESVTEAVSLSDKLKKERKAAISTLVIQGYIIFFIFIVIILMMQFKILPMVSGIASDGSLLGLSGGESISQKDISGAFLYLLLIQGFFSGLTIGKLSEDNIKAGVKHSFVLMFISFISAVGANALFGG